MMIKHSILSIFLSSLALTACAQTKNESTADKTTKTQHDPELQKKVQQLVEKTKKELIFVKGGTFMMGDFGPEHSPDGLSYDGYGHAKPLHKVTLSDYMLSATKASYADFDVYTAATGQKPVGIFSKQSLNERVPNSAAGVNWQQARDYCQWLGTQLNLKMDLPTEVQWEYAARNRGQMIIYPTDNGKVDNGRNIWSFEQRQETSSKYKTVINVPELKQYPPTAMGFYDMITDNYEWMLDWYAADYYSHSSEHNPQGPKTGTKKVVRSTAPDDGQNIFMSGGLTISRHAIDPVADPELVEYFKNSKYKDEVDLNQNNSVRCAANL